LLDQQEFHSLMGTALEIVVRPTEVDVNGHVNNAKYVEYMEWGREEWYERQGLPYARLFALGAVTVNLKSKGAESRCSMTHHQHARRLARPRVGQNQRASAFDLIELWKSNSRFVSSGFDPALGAPGTGAGRSQVRRKETSSAFVSLTQADGCQPASAQSSPLTAELQIMK
jgi:Thioesterase-like superfamily